MKCFLEHEALQNLSTTDGEACEKHWRLAARVRSVGLLINHDELWHSLFIAASEVSALFIFYFTHNIEGNVELA